MLETKTINLMCNVENDVLRTFNTNCPIETIEKIADIVQDTQIALSEGNEVELFIKTVRNLGYKIETIEPIDVFI